jgi:hypothetical protein
MKKIKQNVCEILKRAEWLHRFEYVRKKLGGSWVKTIHRGWIHSETYQFYIAYGFDPEEIQ